MGRAAHAVMLTATVTPAAGMPGTQRADPAIRLQDYCQAFAFYLGLPDDRVDKILLFENSGFDLDVFRRMAEEAGTAKQVEYINVSSTYDAIKGKGYGEFLMIDNALSQSKIIDPATKLWKITGRLKILNLAEIIRTAPSDYEVYCDLRDVPFIGESLGGNKWMELRLFSCTLAAYNRFFRGQYDVGYVLEKDFFQIVAPEVRKRDRRIVPRFRIQPQFEGLSGYSGRSYRSKKDQVKSLLRTVMRRAAPGLWL